LIHGSITLQSLRPKNTKKVLPLSAEQKLIYSHPVLIPRPETELMTRLAIRDLILANLVPVHILDIFPVRVVLAPLLPRTFLML